ncbi:MAG: hypothetical protein ABIQ88_11475 [Chitinophagaceae bacterium]
MLFEYAYYFNNFDADAFSNENMLPGNFIFPLNEKTGGSQPGLFRTLLKSNNKFSFCLADNLVQYGRQYFKEEIIQNLIRLLFLPNYMKQGDKHVFFVKQPDGQQYSLDAIKTQLHSELKKQGIRVQLIEIASVEEALSNNAGLGEAAIIHPLPVNSSGNNADDACLKNITTILTNPDLFSRKWIIPVSSRDELIKKNNELEYIEKQLRVTDPLKVRLIELYNTAIHKSMSMTSENELLKFKLENSANYLQLIRKESHGLIQEIGLLRLEIHRLTQQIISPGSSFQGQPTDDPDFIMQLQAQIMAEQNRANETLTWYKKEYEILPGWYKKGGQLLKVITGRRTFKSLFNKYKNDQGRKSAGKD